MLRRTRLVLGIIVLLLAGYGLITRDFIAQPFMMLGLCAFVLVGGISELKEGKKRRAYTNFFLAAFVLFILVQSFLT